MHSLQMKSDSIYQNELSPDKKKGKIYLCRIPMMPELMTWGVRLATSTRTAVDAINATHARLTRA